MKKVPAHKPMVAVIGGGISGLSAAFWLLQNNIDIFVLEQTDRPGGVIRSENIDGYLIDRAANCLLNYLPELNILCDAVGIRDEQIYRSPVAKNRYLLKDAQPVPMPQDPAGFITTNLLSLRGKARLLSEPLIPRVHAEKEETVSEFVARRSWSRSWSPLSAALMPGILVPCAQGAPCRCCIPWNSATVVSLLGRYSGGSRGAGRVVRCISFLFIAEWKP